MTNSENLVLERLNYLKKYREPYLSRRRKVGWDLYQILNIKKGTLAKGSDGDICIFDLEAPWKVNADKLKSKSKNTAIENRNLQGKILMTYLNGELVYSN